MSTRYENALDLVENAFKQYKSHPAYTCMGKTLTYEELDELSDRLASYLRNDLGMNEGDHFAIQLPNILQFPVAMTAALKAGLVIVNVNPLYTPREVRHQLKDSCVSALLLLSNIADNAAEIIKDTSVKHVIVTDIADLHGFPKKQLINFAVKYIKKMIPEFHFDHSVSFSRTISNPTKPFKRPSLTSDSLMVLQYTGGTTGVSKGAMLTHGNLTSNVWQMMSHMPVAFTPGKEVFIASLPLYHIYALNFHGLSSLACGAHNILIPNPRDLPAMVKTLRSVSMTVFVGINTLFTALCRYPDFKKVDFSALKITSSGGMALTEDAAKTWHKVTGCKVLEGYGLTETSPVLTGNITEDIRLGTIGLAVPETEIRLINEEGKDCEPGEVGELCARGPQVMAGYWKRPKETENVMFDNGFFRTGDMAIKTEDDFYKIVDRKKDMIIVSGFNVYPNEVEDVACQHPKIIEAAAVGIDDEGSGEVVKLFVVREDDSLSQEDVRDFCRTKLTGYKIPKVVEFREELPKSNVGKILRRELREN